MITLDSKTIQNKLLSMKIPEGFRKGVGTKTELFAIEKSAASNFAAQISISLVPRTELAPDGDEDLQTKFLKRVNTGGAAVARLPTPGGFSNDDALGLTFSVSPQVDHLPETIEYRQLCLPYNEDFYLNVSVNYDANNRETMLSVLELATESRKLRKPVTVAEYFSVIEHETENANKFWEKVEAERKAKLKLQILIESLVKDFSLTDVELDIRDALSFSASFDVHDNNYQIRIQLDDSASAKPFVVEARELLKQIDKINQSAKVAIVEEMLDSYNQAWAEEGKQLTHTEFLNQLHSPKIHISEFDCSIFYDTHDDLFHGHSLFVEYELFKNFESFGTSMFG